MRQALTLVLPNIGLAIAAALEGDYRVEHLFVLKQELNLYDIDQQQIQECDQQVEQCLSQFARQSDEPLPPRPKGKKPSRHAPAFDLRSHLYRISGVDFTQIDGLEALTIQSIISEVGLDPTRFPTVKHFTSWLGLCPGSRISGGKVLSSKTRKVVNRASSAFRMAAQSLNNSKTALSAFYRRIRSRLGAPKAITATAHKLARIFYLLWETGKDYVDPVRASPQVGHGIGRCSKLTWPQTLILPYSLEGLRFGSLLTNLILDA